MPTLYVVATPIGNLEDITVRALRVLAEVGLIAAEDTRVTRRLLQRYSIGTPLTSYHEHNKDAVLPSLLSALREKDVAVVSDAGTPGVNDPGAELAEAAAAAGFAVVPLPGPSAVTSAIAASGLAVDQFVYVGFLPRRRVERRRLLDSLKGERRAPVAFEAPHRIRAALEDMDAVLGERRIAVCREMTKLHEEVFRGTAAEALAYFGIPRGEFTVVLEGATAGSGEGPQGEEAAEGILAALRARGVGAKEAVALVAGTGGLSKRRAYRMWVDAPTLPRPDDVGKG